MEALTPASPDSLPPLGELIADDPFWRYPSGSGSGEGVAHLRVWLIADARTTESMQRGLTSWAQAGRRPPPDCRIPRSADRADLLQVHTHASVSVLRNTGCADSSAATSERQRSDGTRKRIVMITLCK